jgi:pimeloyl-[acyl-carrier protein] methyl ester esterase
MQASPGADTALAGLDTLDQRGNLTALQVPLLSVVGGRDAIVPPDIGRAAAKLAPRGRVAEFEDCGHAPFLEDGPRYRATLLEFLGTLE